MAGFFGEPAAALEFLCLAALHALERFLEQVVFFRRARASGFVVRRGFVRAFR
ncbi:MAG: hypothetical protein R3F11_26810 [Verrucomicrobiales bacterium]